MCVLQGERQKTRTHFNMFALMLILGGYVVMLSSRLGGFASYFIPAVIAICHLDVVIRKISMSMLLLMIGVSGYWRGDAMLMAMCVVFTIEKMLCSVHVQERLAAGLSFGSMCGLCHVMSTTTMAFDQRFRLPRAPRMAMMMKTVLDCFWLALYGYGFIVQFNKQYYRASPDGSNKAVALLLVVNMFVSSYVFVAMLLRALT